MKHIKTIILTIVASIALSATFLPNLAYADKCKSGDTDYDAAAAADPAQCPPATGGGGVQDGLNTVKSSADSNGKTLPEIINIIINIILFIVGILSVVMLIYGGIKYSTSAGDSSKMTGAKNTIMYAIVGLVISILAFAIVQFVVSRLTTPTTTP